MGVPSLPSKVTRKIAFRNRLETLLSQFPKFVLIGAEHVGSKQLQMIRQSLRGKAEILMGKNVPPPFVSHYLPSLSFPGGYLEKKMQKEEKEMRTLTNLNFSFLGYI